MARLKKLFSRSRSVEPIETELPDAPSKGAFFEPTIERQPQPEDPIPPSAPPGPGA